MKIYVASSWRNDIQPKVVEALRIQGHEVYDFKNPEPGDNGFHWSEIDSDWQNWTPDQFRKALEHPIAKTGFSKDMKALIECDACVLVMPSGRSAHLEAGYAIGAGKPTIILLSESEPELMYKMTPFICLDIAEVQGNIDFIADQKEKLKPCPFCGSPAELYGECDMVWVRCSNDDCRAERIYSFDEPEEAIEDWNKRA